jgi:hypothetical protein
VTSPIPAIRRWQRCGFTHCPRQPAYQRKHRNVGRSGHTSGMIKARRSWTSRTLLGVFRVLQRIIIHQQQAKPGLMHWPAARRPGAVHLSARPAATANTSSAHDQAPRTSRAGPCGPQRRPRAGALRALHAGTAGTGLCLGEADGFDQRGAAS